MSSDASALDRAAQLLRLAGPEGPAPEVRADGAALRCPSSGRLVPVRDGIVDFLADGFRPTIGQRMLDTAGSAWLYDMIRPHLGRLIGMPSFASEVENVSSRLQLSRGDTVLDIACGQGNFTLELARVVGPGGLVIGLDISGAMLRRAVHHVEHSGLSNVVLVRADAMSLPFVDRGLSFVNCSGGLHQFPDLKRTLVEIARVSAPQARLTMSGFASRSRGAVVGFRRWAQRFDIDFVPMDELETQMQSAGYTEIGGDMPSRWVGYRWGTKSASP